MKEKILRFIEFNKFPLVTTLTELNSASVFSSPINLQVSVYFHFVVYLISSF